MGQWPRVVSPDRCIDGYLMICINHTHKNTIFGVRWGKGALDLLGAVCVGGGGWIRLTLAFSWLLSKVFSASHAAGTP